MGFEPTRAIEVFYSYAHKDELLRKELEKHLSNLQRQGLIVSWHDRNINAGTEWAHEIDTHLNTAQIILLLVSADFMHSDYCYSIEMKRALERHKAGEAHVIPIILRPVDWEDAPFSKLQVLPTDGKPIDSSDWHNRDEAFRDVARGIRQVIRASITQTQWAKEQDDSHYYTKHYHELVKVYEQAIHLDPNDADAYYNKGRALGELGYYNEALVSYEQAIHLDPNGTNFYREKGDILYRLRRYDEAIVAYEQAIRLDSNDAIAYRNKGRTLWSLQRNDEALITYEQYIRLAPNDADAYYFKGGLLNYLKRYSEALIAYDEAIRLDPNNAIAYSGKSRVLEYLGRTNEARQADKRSKELAHRWWSMSLRTNEHGPHHL